MKGRKYRARWPIELSRSNLEKWAAELIGDFQGKRTALLVEALWFDHSPPKIRHSSEALMPFPIRLYSRFPVQCSVTYSMLTSSQFLCLTIFACLCLPFASCATVPATLKIQGDEILRGSASGSLGSDAIISLKNIDGLSCEGKMFVPFSSANTEGAIECNDKRKGNFIANGNAASWAGEGKFDDGSKFSILIGPQSTTVKY